MPQLSKEVYVTLTVEIEEPTKFTVIDYEPKSVTTKPGEVVNITFKKIAWDKPLPGNGRIVITAYIERTARGSVIKRVSKGATEVGPLTLSFVAPDRPGTYTVRIIIVLQWSSAVVKGVPVTGVEEVEEVAITGREIPATEREIPAIRVYY